MCGSLEGRGVFEKCVLWLSGVKSLEKEGNEMHAMCVLMEMCAENVFVSVCAMCAVLR